MLLSVPFVELQCKALPIFWASWLLFLTSRLQTQTTYLPDHFFCNHSSGGFLKFKSLSSLRVKLSLTEGVSGLAWMGWLIPCWNRGICSSFWQCSDTHRGAPSQRQSKAKATCRETTRHACNLLWALGCRLSLAQKPSWHRAGAPPWLSWELFFQPRTKQDAFNWPHSF